MYGIHLPLYNYRFQLSVIDQNELRVDIYLKPVRAAEFILVNFYAVNTDVNFEEIVGQ